MKRIVAGLLLAGVSSALAAGRVIDVGQLEIEGEVRRPNLNWVDSQKAVNGMLPGFHRDRFRALEVELLRPARIQDVKSKLKTARAGGGDENARD